MGFTKQGRVEGLSIVFGSPLPLSDGTQVTVQIEAVPGGADTPTKAPADITALPFFGMWSDREDMTDAAAWVRRERDNWQQRHENTGLRVTARTSDTSR